MLKNTFVHLTLLKIILSDFQGRNETLLIIPFCTNQCHNYYFNIAHIYKQKIAFFFHWAEERDTKSHHFVMFLRIFLT